MELNILIKYIILNFYSTFVESSLDHKFSDFLFYQHVISFLNYSAVSYTNSLILLLASLWALKCTVTHSSRKNFVKMRNLIQNNLLCHFLPFLQKYLKELEMKSPKGTNFWQFYLSPKVGVCRPWEFVPVSQDAPYCSAMHNPQTSGRQKQGDS